MSDNPEPALSAAKRALLGRRIQGQTAVPRRAASSLAPREGAGPAPLSQAQEQLWHFSQLAPGNPVYNESVTIRKDGSLDLTAFRAAFNELVRRHEIWRTTFQSIDGEPRQVVHPPLTFELPVFDLSNFPRDEVEREATRVAAQEAKRPYDLERGPMIRPLLVRFTANHHRLYLAMHHLIFDGVSLYRVILPELIALYDAFTAGRPSPLVAPAVQYGDYALWDRDNAARADYAQALVHWRQRLGDAPLLSLPLDHPRPPVQRFRGGMEPLEISKALADRLDRLSRRANSTFFQIMACAFAVLLSRYSGQEDVVFGTVVDLRDRPELEAMVGYCLSPLVLRVDLSGDPLFLQLLRQVRETLLDGLEHKIPFQRLVSELQPNRDSGANPIFQAMLVQEPPVVTLDPNWSLHQMEPEVGNAVGHAKVDLHMELDRRPDGHVSGRLIYNSDLFERDTAQRIVGHWAMLLQGIVDGPDWPVSTLPLLTDVERRQQVLKWNATEADFPRGVCLHQLIAAQAGRTPGKVAVCDSSTQLSYAELDDRAARLAARLRELGVCADRLVCVCLERSVDLVTALLAVLKAGGAYVPLEPDQPRARIQLMIEDARPQVILTTANLQDLVSPRTAPIVLIDADRLSWMQHEPVSAANVEPTSLAYVLYTSGSTGQPKGVMVEHRAIVNQLVWRIGAFGLDPRDRVLQKTPFGFDVSLWELFCPLICGATVVMLDPGAHMDPHLMAATIAAERITALHFVPSMLKLFLDEVGALGGTTVRLVAASGETLTAAQVSQFYECFGADVALFNLYGPTEASVDATFWRCQPADTTVPIGRPVANTQVYVLDRHLVPVPVGVPGELCIGGVGVARGYLNRPQLTSERFVANPFRSGERIYRTGDSARWRSDGVIEYLGRSDGMVKVRGNRIELGEVEAAIMTDPAVKQVLVALRPDAHGDPVLVAYIVGQDADRLPTTAELRAVLTGLLPNYMMPAAFVSLETLPLTRNGKIDHKALPNPEYRTSEYSAPQGELETRLAQLFAEVLRLQRVGTDDNFFELGGQSLLAAKLVVRLREEFGKELPLRLLFEHSSVAGLAAELASINEVGALSAPPIRRLRRQ